VTLSIATSIAIVCCGTQSDAQAESAGGSALTNASCWLARLPGNPGNLKSDGSKGAPMKSTCFVHERGCSTEANLKRECKASRYAARGMILLVAEEQRVARGAFAMSAGVHQKRRAAEPFARRMSALLRNPFTNLSCAGVFAMLRKAAATASCRAATSVAWLAAISEAGVRRVKQICFYKIRHEKRLPKGGSGIPGNMGAHLRMTVASPTDERFNF
jgi:hypothetical protein